VAQDPDCHFTETPNSSHGNAPIATFSMAASTMAAPDNGSPRQSTFARKIGSSIL